MQSYLIRTRIIKDMKIIAKRCSKISCSGKLLSGLLKNMDGCERIQRFKNWGANNLILYMGELGYFKLLIPRLGDAIH